MVINSVRRWGESPERLLVLDESGKRGGEGGKGFVIEDGVGLIEEMEGLIADGVSLLEDGVGLNMEVGVRS